MGACCTATANPAIKVKIEVKADLELYRQKLVPFLKLLSSKRDI